MNTEQDRLAAVEQLVRDAYARQGDLTFPDGEPRPVIVLAVDVWHALGNPMPAPNGEAVYPG